MVVEDSMDNVRYVEAESNTGSRYAVFVTRLTSVMRDRAGGPLLVTVLWPWQDSWCLQESGVLTAEYVGEKLTCHRYKDRRVNAGDLTALTMTVAYALNRTTFLPSELL